VVANLDRHLLIQKIMCGERDSTRKSVVEVCELAWKKQEEFDLRPMKMVWANNKRIVAGRAIEKEDCSVPPEGRDEGYQQKAKN
jgi:hypothetical protein